MELGYYPSKGILLSEEIKTISKKSNNPLQPVFEALINSFEAIENLKKGKITICFNVHKDLFTEKDKSITEKYYFNNITISDNGIGFNEKEFSRIYTLRDNSKNINNKGTGRIQYLHYFEKSHFSSIYKDNKSSTKYKSCEFVLSKTAPFLSKNAIILVEKDEESSSKKNGTIVTFTNPMDDKDYEFYAKITPEEVKELCIKHYLNYFCRNISILPSIEIKRIVNDNESSVFINEDDIPKPSHTEPIQISYSLLKDNQIVSIPRKEEFILTVFLIDNKKLQTNNIILTSKGAEAKKFDIDCLLPNEKIHGNRYLVLVSSPYIDQRDSDIRGDIKILTSDQFIEHNKDMFESEEVILLDTIIKETNTKLQSICPEIGEKYKEKQKSLTELKEMFLLNDKSINESDIKIDDSDEMVLRKVYQADAKIAAKNDAALKKLLKEAEAINPENKETYQQEINVIAKKYVQALPLQNRNELAQYIARRRLLLTCIDSILDKQKKSGNKDKKITESILHNYIFQKRSTNAENSNLWFINEEFIYFQGFSDIELSLITIGNEKIFKDKFSKEEKDYLTSLGENRTLKRPDVLLFPAESKCIIIELKAPDENVSNHLMQISKYANLIANYSKGKFKFNTFYGYLIGEAIEPKEVFSIGNNNWIIAEHFDYIFSPLQNIYDNHNMGKVIGSLYTEIIKYSTLLERAKMRNKIFIDKLEHDKLVN
jgi:hypothetical protein